MKYFMRYLFLLLIPVVTFSQIGQQNFILTSCRDAGLDKGDKFHRTVFNIGIPSSYPHKAQVRVFDADIGDRFDMPGRDSETRYLIFGRDHIRWDLLSLADSISPADALFELKLQANPYYDNRWRTLTELDPAEGQRRGELVFFQLVVDGIRGSGRNLYQLYISASDKRNEAVEGCKITVPSLSLRLPSEKNRASQITFDIPAEVDTLIVANYDADAQRSPARINLETKYRTGIAMPQSGDGDSAYAFIAIDECEKGQPAAIVVQENSAANNVQFFVTDREGEIIWMHYPPRILPVNRLPIPRVAIVPLSDCNTVILDASQSTDPDGGELSYRWLFSDGTSETGVRIVHDFKKPGKHTVELLVIDDSDFIANTARHTETVIINAPPRAKIDGPDKAAPYQTVAFDGGQSSDSDGQIRSYRWDFGDGKTADGVRVEHRYSRPGTYQVTLIVEDDGTSLCTKARAQSEIWINKSPVGKLNMSKNLVAVNESVTFDAIGSIDSDGEIVGYFWDFGDGTTAESQSAEHRYSAPGRYKVRLMIEDDSGLKNATSDIAETITVNAPPVARAQPPEVVAAEELLVLDAAQSRDPDGSITEYYWNLGDGTRQEGRKISHKYATPATYPVTLKVVDNTATANNSDEVAYRIRVNDPPRPDAGGDRIVNVSVVQFDAGNSSDSDDEIITYSWDFGDNTKGEGRQLEHVYAHPGTYQVTLTVVDASGTSTGTQSETITVVVNNPPIADAGREKVVSVGEKVRFNGRFSQDPDGKIVSYRWDVDEGVILEGKRVEYTYSRPGNYQVLLTVTDDNGALDYHYTTIYVNDPPIPVIGPIPRIAPSQVFKFDGSESYDVDGEIEVAEWDFGDGSTMQEGLQVAHAYGEPGRYTVTLTLKDNSNATNGTAATTQLVAVNYPPKPDCGDDVITCDQTILFEAANSSDADKDKLTYFWDFGDGQTGTGMRLKHTYITPGVYPVVLKVDDGMGLANSIQQTIIRVQVNSPPMALAVANRDTVCAGEPVLFDASHSLDREKDLLRYLWDFGDETSAEGINPIHAFKRGGNYRVRLTVMDDSNLPCNASIADLLIHVIDAPVADAGEDQQVCANTVVQFDGSKSSGGDRLIKSYEWDFGDGERGGGINPTHVYTTPGIYNVRLVIMVPEIGDCENTSEADITVQVIAAPTAKFTMIEEGCVGEAIVMDASDSFAGDASIVEYAWDFGDGASGNGAEVTHAYQSSGRYKVTLSIRSDSEQGCNTAQISHEIKINEGPTAEISVHASNDQPNSGPVYRSFINTVLNFSASGSKDGDGFIKRYNWNFGDGETARGVSAQHFYSQVGSYTVTLDVADNSSTDCNKAADQITVEIADYSAISIEGPGAAFVGEPMTYKVVAEKLVTPTEENTTWYFSDGTTMQGLEVTKSFPKSGKYQVQAKCGNLWSMAKVVTIDDLPTTQLPPVRTIDLGNKIVLKPIVSNPFNVPVQLEWDLGDGATIKAAVAEYVYEKAGEYTITLKVWYKEYGYGQPKVYTQTVTVLPEPQVNIEISPDRIYTGGARDEVIVKAVSKPYPTQLNYLWDFGDGFTAAGKVSKHTYAQPGDYTVRVTARDATRADAKSYVFRKEIAVKKR